MGVPLLFTDASGTPTLTVVPFPGLFVSDDLFLGDDVFLDDGPTLQFYATAPTVGAFGVTVSVDPEPVTFSGAEAILPTAGQQVVAVVPVPVVFRGDLIATQGLPIVVVSVPVPVVFGAEIPATTGGQLLILIPSIRELPPLRLTHHLVTPSGRHFRWAPDDPNPTLVPSGERFGDTMPGGFETADCVLPRKPGTDYSDVERLSTWQILGAGSEVAWEGRLERAPRVSGDQMSVSPSAVGFQAALEDDKSAQVVYVDRAMGGSGWGETSATRKVNMAGAGFNATAPTIAVVPNETNNRPGLMMTKEGLLYLTHMEWVYDSGGAKVRRMYATFANINLAAGDLKANGRFFLWDTDAGAGEVQSTQFQATTVWDTTFATPKRFGGVLLQYSGSPDGVEGRIYGGLWENLTVYGDHTVPIRGVMPGGVLASDVVQHAVARWAPMLRFDSVSVRPSSFVIPHLAFLDRTSPAEIVRQASRFGLEDWAVWDGQDGPTFHWHQRGAQGRKWRARVNPAQLEETGPQLDRLWESVIVQYQDVDGTVRTVGPPGSGANVESLSLKDSDPENPANQLGIVRRELLQMGTSTSAGAIEIGRRFLEESRQFDKSGRARFVGHVEDDRGVLHPYWKPRAGDYVTFVDSNDTSYRRIVKTDKDHASRTCSVDLDAPPEGLQELLERLGVVLVPLGFS